MIADEMPAITAWAARRGNWAVGVDHDELRLTAATQHPTANTPLRIEADLRGYRAIPPAWRFLDPTTGEAEDSAFPAPGNTPGISGSIFHSNKVICAPWNRLAFKENGGPHEDWGALTNWMVAGAGYTKADTLADMLSQIAIHLATSPGVYT